MAVPLARFYTRSMLLDMSRIENEKPAQHPQRKSYDGRREEPSGAKWKMESVPGPTRSSKSRTEGLPAFQANCVSYTWAGDLSKIRHGVCHKVDQVVYQPFIATYLRDAMTPDPGTFK